jgi:hypothetical protein
MADKAILGSAALDVAIDAETHVDFIDRLDTVHSFNWSMAFLTCHAGPNMRLVNEFHKIGQYVDTIPANFEWRLMVISPSPGDRLDTAQQGATMAPNASLYRGNARHRRPSSVLMAILAGDLVDAGMDTMAEGNRLVDIGTGRPWPLGESDRSNSAGKQE